ncbi:hypothetical protein [Sulfolobus polyhedral virus 3]|nr:hypothetical protein [Sulfolobus polyhedral virus 3]
MMIWFDITLTKREITNKKTFSLSSRLSVL